MKRTTALALLGLVCLMAVPNIAHARYRDGMNLYQYVGSAPVQHVDPMGLQASQPAECPCKIFLSFDDGPRWGTDDVLDVLDEVKLQGKATFFIIGVHTETTFRFKKPWRGKKAWKGTEMVKLIHDLGNLVANHSYSHANDKYRQYYKNPDGVLADFEKNRKLLEGILGEEYKGGTIGRLPGRNTWRVGEISSTDRSYSSDSKAAADKLAGAGYTLFGWDAEYAAGAHGEAARKALLDKIDAMCAGTQEPRKKGSVVILLHDHNHRNSRGGRAPLKKFLEALQERKGYTFHRLDKY